jgi:hypothetical protein
VGRPERRLRQYRLIVDGMVSLSHPQVQRLIDVGPL